MKSVRVIFVLVGFVFLGIADATTIDLTAQYLGDGFVQIGYARTDGSTVPMAISLEMSVTDGAMIDPGGSYVSAGDFNFSPDYIFDYLTDGHPFARIDRVGVQNSPSETVSFSAGYQLTPGVDLNYDGRKDDADMAWFIQDWLWRDYSAADLNADNVVNMADLALFNGTTMAADPVVENLFTLYIQDVIVGQTQLIIHADTLRAGVFDANGDPVIVNPLVMTIVPEPATVVLLGLGGLALKRRKKG